MTMIAHVSLPSRDTRHAAMVLAEILGGEAMPFPPGGPHAWMAWSHDETTELEVLPLGGALTQGPEGAFVQEGPAQAHGFESHVAICVDRPAAEVVAIAEREGWRTGIFDRGGFFHVVEVWVDNAYLIEFLDPTYAAEYKRSMTPAHWKATFGVQPAV